MEWGKEVIHALFMPHDASPLFGENHFQFAHATEAAIPQNIPPPVISVIQLSFQPTPDQRYTTYGTYRILERS